MMVIQLYSIKGKHLECGKIIIKLLDNSNFKVVAPDQRGYSPKAKPKGIDSYKIDLLAKDIIDIADVFIMKAFHLVLHDKLCSWLVYSI